MRDSDGPIVFIIRIQRLAVVRDIYGQRARVWALRQHGSQRDDAFDVILFGETQATAAVFKPLVVRLRPQLRKNMKRVAHCDVIENGLRP